MRLKGKWLVSLYLVAPPQADAVYSANSSFCSRATFRVNLFLTVPPVAFEMYIDAFEMYLRILRRK